MLVDPEDLAPVDEKHDVAILDPDRVDQAEDTPESEQTAMADNCALAL